MVEVEQIGVVECDKEAEEYDLLTNIEKSDMDDDDFEDATEATRTMVTSLYGKGFTANKTSRRAHPFDTDGLDDDEDHDVKSLLASIQEGDDFESDLKSLAEIYIETNYSHSGILIVARFEEDNANLTAVIKAPYSTGYEPDDSVGLSELEEIIEPELKKGGLYPRIERSTGATVEDEMGLYQSSWSQHWWKFFGVEEVKTNDEVLHEKIVKESNDTPLDDVTDVEDVYDADLPEDVLNGTVKITITGIELNVELRDIVEKNVRLVHEDSSYHVVISGNEPNISAKNTGSGEYWEDILDELQSYETFDDLQG